MLSRNRLRTGEFVALVPYGIPATIQYDDRGVFEKVFIGYGDNRSDRTKDIKSIVSDMVPNKISLKGGTSWVQGVFQTDIDIKKDGSVLSIVTSSLVDEFIKDKSRFQFMSFNVISNTGKFYGAGPTRQWLQMSGFSLLNGCLVPASNRDKTINEFFTKHNTKPVPIFSVSFNNTEVLITPLAINQFVCKKVSQRLDSEGYLHAIIKSDSGETHSVYFNEVVDHNVSTGSVVYMSGQSIIYASNSSKQTVSRIITCPACGRSYRITSESCCDDLHCISKRYNQFKKLTRLFNIPDISYPYYISLMKSYRFTSISDILVIDEFKDFKASCTIFDLLRVYLSCAEVDDVTLSKFSAGCNNSKSRLEYYIHSPDSLVDDMNLDSRYGSNLVKFFKDTVYSSEILDILYLNNFSLSVENKMFDGAPIFRGKRLFVTGSFKHGSLEEISSILSSYSAQITFEYEGKIDLVLVGDISEGVNGVAVKNAMSSNIPVMHESEFFKRYEIDDDIQQNLV